MGESLRIAFLIFYLTFVYSQTPAQVLNNFCPCQRQSLCRNVFGAAGTQGGFADILKVIPTCGTGEVRCCNKKDMVEGLMTVLHQANSGQASAAPGIQQPSAAPPAGGGHFFSNRQATGGSGEAAATAPQLLPGQPSSTPANSDVSIPGGASRIPAQSQGRVSSGAHGLSGAGFGSGGGAPGAPGAVGGGVGAPGAPGAVGGGGGSVKCVSASLCRLDDIYGTNPQHFIQYGFISPSQTKCFSDSGNILCVVQAGSGGAPAAPQTKPAAPVFPPGPVPTPPPPSLPAATASAPLPCLPVAGCAVVFGTVGGHFVQFGGQSACPSLDRVRCVTPVAVTQPPIRPTTSPPTRPSTRPPTRPTPPPTPTTRPPAQPTHSVILPCFPVALCLVPYGVVGAHFAQYGRQPRCPVQAE